MLCLCDANDEYQQKKKEKNMKPTKNLAASIVVDRPTYTKFHLIPSNRRTFIRRCNMPLSQHDESEATTPNMFSTNVHRGNGAIRADFFVGESCECVSACFEFRMNFWREVIKMVLYASIVRIFPFFFFFFSLLCSSRSLCSSLCYLCSVPWMVVYYVSLFTA